MQPARANGQPAFAAYERGAGGAYRVHGVQVLAVAPGAATAAPVAGLSG